MARIRIRHTDTGDTAVVEVVQHYLGENTWRWVSGRKVGFSGSGYWERGREYFFWDRPPGGTIGAFAFNFLNMNPAVVIANFPPGTSGIGVVSWHGGRPLGLPNMEWVSI